MQYGASAAPQSRAPEQTLLPQGYQSASQAVPQHGLHTGSPYEGFPFSQAKSWHLCTFRDRSWHFDDDMGPIICATAD